MVSRFAISCSVSQGRLANSFDLSQKNGSKLLGLRTPVGNRERGSSFLPSVVCLFICHSPHCDCAAAVQPIFPGSFAFTPAVVVSLSAFPTSNHLLYIHPPPLKAEIYAFAATGVEVKPFSILLVLLKLLAFFLFFLP